MPTPKSTVVFHAIQIGAFLAVALLFGGPLVYRGMHDGPMALAWTITGGTFVFLGASFVYSGAPRIYDPSRSETFDDVQRGYGRVDGEQVYIEQATGTSEMHYSRPLAIRATVTGLVVCTAGLLFGLFFRL